MSFYNFKSFINSSVSPIKKQKILLYSVFFYYSPILLPESFINLFHQLFISFIEKFFNKYFNILDFIIFPKLDFVFFQVKFYFCSCFTLYKKTFKQFMQSCIKKIKNQALTIAKSRKIVLNRRFKARNLSFYLKHFAYKVLLLLLIIYKLFQDCCG